MTVGSVAALMSSARGVVFDKDGTLIDLDARWVPVFDVLIGRLADECDDPTLIAALSDLLGIEGEQLIADGPAAVDTAEQIIGRVIAALVARGHDAAGAEERVSAIAAEAVSTFGPIQPIGDVAGSLTALRTAGLNVGLATSDDRNNTVDELSDLAVIGLIDAMRCADDGGPVKPDPSVLTSIAQEWGVPACDLVFVGDSRNDLDTARAAGCSFIVRCDVERIPGWAASADATIASIDELVL